MNQTSLDLTFNKSLLIFILLITSHTCIASSEIITAADNRLQFLASHFREPENNIAENSFWIDPINKKKLGPGNGWQGAQAAQGLLLTYLRTHDIKYLGILQSYADWLMYTTTYDKTSATVGLNAWSDDAGWNICNYIMLYKLNPISNRDLLDQAYLLMNIADAEWGINLQGNSRALRYNNDAKSNGKYIFTSYSVSYLLGALELYQSLQKIDSTRAGRSLEFACRLYNFFENYLHSTGIGNLNIKNVAFTTPKDIYQGHASFWHQDNPAVDATPSLASYGGFLFAQMGMAAAYEIFSQIDPKEEKLSLINPLHRNFKQRAINAADVILKQSPNGLTEPSNVNGELVLINAHDKRVNGFACYWWIKYVVPLDSKYGSILIQTANTIITNFKESLYLGSCWNSNSLNSKGERDGSSNSYRCKNSKSLYEGSEFPIHANTATIIAAAALIDEIASTPFERLAIRDSSTINQLQYSKDEISYRDFFAVMSLNYEIPVDMTSIYNLDTPVTNITWYDAILFCNEKSRRLGLQPIYSFDKPAVFNKDRHCVQLVNLKVDLTRNGFRLPSPAEYSKIIQHGNSQLPYGIAKDHFAQLSELVMSYENPLMARLASGDRKIQPMSSISPWAGFRIVKAGFEN